MKKCPFCAEEIQDEAVKCKHCGEFLIDAELKGLRKNAGVKWYYKTSFVVISVLCFGPLALPLVLYNPQYSVPSKVFWTIIIIVVTVVLCVGSIEAYALLLKQIQQMGL
ncbi:MAG: zinc ribbon domain-containing protein [Sedimentisphaerales bacterium]|jgi:predicted nucleic acid-binding Zn ribbon protein